MTQYIVNGIEFKTGDKVRVERKINSHAADGMGEAGKWSNSWVDAMDSSIGKEFTIASINVSGARFKDESYLGYPLTALTNLSALLKAGDVVRCMDSGRLFITYGHEYTVQEDQKPMCGVVIKDNDGDRATYNSDKFELVRRAGEKAQAAAPAGFKVGDKVKVVNDDNCSYISNGDVATVSDVDSNGRVKLANVCAHYYEAARFVLDAPAPAARKLKLPLAVTRLGGALVVLTAGPKDGEVTLVYAESGVTSTYTEADVLSKLDENVWSVNGAEDNKQAVADATAALQTAKDAVTAAEAALATAEATAAQKPYLA